MRIFENYTPSLANKFKDVNKRLIGAFGLDTENENARIDWVQYIGLKCFLEKFTISKEIKEEIWMKIIDPKSVYHVPMADFTFFIERLARGAMHQAPTTES